MKDTDEKYGSPSDNDASPPSLKKRAEMIVRDVFNKSAIDAAFARLRGVETAEDLDRKAALDAAFAEFDREDALARAEEDAKRKAMLSAAASILMPQEMRAQCVLSQSESFKMSNAQLEKDPNGKQPGEPGAKFDAGKSPVRKGLLEYFPRACLAVAEVSASGAQKYTWNGWGTVPDGVNRYGDAEVRHICKAAIEGKIDKDYGHLHAAHEAWNALARLELLLREEEERA